MFQHGLVRAERCTHCDWEYERGHGFWIGGSEVHMFASYGISVVIFIPLLILLGPTPAVQAAVILGHVACSLLLLRYSRAAFIGIDYYLDPGHPDRGDGDNEDDGVPVQPRPSRPLRRQRRRTPADLRRPSDSPRRKLPTAPETPV